MDNPFPNPVVKHFTTMALFPYNLEAGGKIDSGTDFLKGFEEKVLCHSLRLPEGWEDRTPDNLGKHRLDRWFFREVRNLLFDDRKEDRELADDSEKRRFKFRWIQHLKYHEKLKKKDGENVSIAIVGPFKNGKKPETLQITILAHISDLELFALFGHIGTAILGVRCKIKDIPLKTALEVVHYASLQEGSMYALAFVPGSNAKLKEIKSGDQSSKGRDKAGEPLVFTAEPEELADCLLLPQVVDNGGLSSIVVKMRNELFPIFNVPGYDSASRGRIPVAVNLDLTPDLNVTDHEWQQIEWLCARFLRHPGALGNNGTWVLPITGGVDMDPAVTTVRPTGSRSLHLTSEGFASVGRLVTKFDSDWQPRFNNEYFFAYLVALHQSIVLQDISWKSFAKTFETEKEMEYHDQLFNLFKDFDTAYNFSRISNHVTMQSVYDAARKTLGVPETADEIRSELQNWIESESREEQRNLNAMAVVAVLASTATFLVSLDLEYFNGSSKVKLIEFTGLWFWVPMALVISATVLVPRLRKHLLRAYCYLCGRRP